jgi:hypothetical protein
VQNAQFSFVGKDAAISADATASGNGGKIIVWGDQAARAHGTLSARGGQGGNGGLVETSGHFLDVDGVRVDTRAQGGKAGLWLLDPEYITIATGGTASREDVANFGAGAASGITSISPETINAATTHVALQARRDITFVDAVSIAAQGVGVSAQAGGSINVNAALTTNGGPVILQANLGDTATGSGAVNVNSALNTNGGNLVLSGAGVALNAAVRVGLGDADLRVNKAGGSIAIGANGSLAGSSDAS